MQNRTTASTSGVSPAASRARRLSARMLSLVLAAVLGALAFAVPAHADRLSELEEEREQLEQQRRQNEREQEEVASALEGTNADLAETYLELDSINRRLRSEEHTSELQSRGHLVCRLLLEKKKIQ